MIVFAVGGSDRGFHYCYFSEGLCLDGRLQLHQQLRRIGFPFLQFLSLLLHLFIKFLFLHDGYSLSIDFFANFFYLARIADQLFLYPIVD